MSRPLLALCCVLALSACSKPEKPETERPPTPQASRSADRATELSDAIQAPINKAKSVEATTLEAAQQQSADIDAHTGGNASASPPAE